LPILLKTLRAPRGNACCLDSQFSTADKTTAAARIQSILSMLASSQQPRNNSYNAASTNPTTAN
jgi:hypothetical protein